MTPSLGWAVANVGQDPAGAVRVAAEWAGSAPPDLEARIGIAYAVRLVGSALLGDEAGVNGSASALAARAPEPEVARSIAEMTVSVAHPWAIPIARALPAGTCPRPACPHDPWSELIWMGAQALATEEARRDWTAWLNGRLNASLAGFGGAQTSRRPSRSGAAAFDPDDADPIRGALGAEARAEWATAAGRWREAGKDREAWEASLIAGIPPTESVPADVSEWWRWRLYAVTGTGRPAGAPPDAIAARHAAIGEARSTLRGIVRGDDPTRGGTPDAYGAWRVRKALTTLYGAPEKALARMAAGPPPARPLDLVARMESEEGAPGEPAFDLDAWSVGAVRGAAVEPTGLELRDRLAEGIVDGRVPPGALAHVRRTLDAGALLVALATSDLDDADLRAARAEALEPGAVASATAGFPRELLAVCHALAADRKAAAHDRIAAGEVAGALLAALVRSDADARGAARRAAKRVQDALGDLVLPDTVLAPTVAFDIDDRILHGTHPPETAPVLAWWSGHKDLGARRGREAIVDLYGPKARGSILAEAGAGMAGYTRSVADLGPAAIPARVIDAVAAALIASGRLGDVVAMASANGHVSESTLGLVVEAASDRESVDLTRAIRMLEELHGPYRTSGNVKQGLARLYVQRARKSFLDDADPQKVLGDLDLARTLGAESVLSRELRAFIALRQASSHVRISPRAAVSLIEAVAHQDPGSGNVRDAVLQRLEALDRAARHTRDYVLATSATLAIERVRRLGPPTPP